MGEQFNELSKKFNSLFSKEKRLDQGIFFTPKKGRGLLFSKLHELGIDSPKTVLEPSFGSGEFLLDAYNIYPEAKLFGIEKNTELFNAVKQLSIPNSTLINCDFLDYTSDVKFDLIIGNPPYFVNNRLSKKELSNCLTGRPNIYIIFIYNCLVKHLDTSGVLAFIVPTSLYNCSYYQPTREYISKNTTILHLETLNKPGFYETGQETTLVILQKGKRNDNFLFSSQLKTYISPFYKELYELTDSKPTLVSLGLGVKTGSIVWNQHKEQLSDKGTLLIYSSNIKNGVLTLNNLLGKEKKQYINGIDKETIDGPVILVERGYGNSYRFNSVIVELKQFYAENHLNVVYAKTPEGVNNLVKVQNSFIDKRTQEFIKMFIGNGSLSSTDMETILPIFI